MVRWRYCLFLAMLLILPIKAGSKLDDDDDDTLVDDADGDDEEEDDEEDDPPSEKLEHFPIGRRAPAVMPSSSTTTEVATRTIPRRPLECYVCAYKAETQLRSCLDPTKYRVHTMVCHSAEDKCFTSVISKGNSYEAVLRGCRSACVGTPETTCCELNRCNNQALAAPVAPRALDSTPSNSTKAIPPSILFFVTILLVLQTVVKVPFV